MSPLTCQIAEKKTQTSAQVLICKYDTVQIHKNGVHITYEQPKPYMWNTNRKCKYQNNL